MVEDLHVSPVALASPPGCHKVRAKKFDELADGVRVSGYVPKLSRESDDLVHQATPGLDRRLHLDLESGLFERPDESLVLLRVDASAQADWE